MDDLFRDEAVQAQRQQALGTMRLATPVSQLVWGICAAVATIVIALWLVFGHYTRREHVTGTLVPQAGLLTVTARDAGVVPKLDVRPGERVRAGQALLAIIGVQSSAAIGDTDAAVAKALQSQQVEVHATLAALPQQAADQAKDLRRRIKMLRAQVEQVSAQLVLLHKQAATAESLVQKAKPLARNGDISAIEWDSYQAPNVRFVEGPEGTFVRSTIGGAWQRDGGAVDNHVHISAFAG